MSHPYGGGGHEATDTQLTIIPVSQTSDHSKISSFASQRLMLVFITPILTGIGVLHCSTPLCDSWYLWIAPK